MRKLILIAIAVVLVVALGAGAVWASNGMRASKATAVVGDITWLDPNTGSFETILDQPIKMAQNKDLFVDVSMLCGLFTQTEVTAISQSGWDEGTAVAKIMVRVYAEDEDLVKHWACPTAGFDGAAPDDGIIFAMRQQDLWAQLNTNNTSDNMTIGLALDTMDAHAFNFIIPNLDSGEYTVVIQAMTYSDPVVAKGKNKGAGNAAWAGIGYGSVTIEQVRMAKDTVIVELPPD